MKSMRYTQSKQKQIYLTTTTYQVIKITRNVRTDKSRPQVHNFFSEPKQLSLRVTSGGSRHGLGWA